MKRSKMKPANAGDLIRQEMAKNPEMAARIEAELQQLRISDAIREARKEAGLSQKELALKINTGQSAIARLESSNYQRFSLFTLAKIAIALNIPLLQIFKSTSAKLSNLETIPSRSK
jgi:ribosome-binding protein aMBF1 (putative translation factor)